MGSNPISSLKTALEYLLEELKACHKWHAFITKQNRNGGIFMTFDEIFKKVKDMFKDTDVSDVTEHIAYQFNITGEGAGSFYVEVKDGKLNIEPYEYYDRDVIFICKADTLFNIISGKTDPVMAFTLGRLKVEGSIEQALKLKNFIK